MERRSKGDGSEGDTEGRHEGDSTPSLLKSATAHALVFPLAPAGASTSATKLPVPSLIHISSASPSFPRKRSTCPSVRAQGRGMGVRCGVRGREPG